MSAFPPCHRYGSSAVSGFPISCKAGSRVLPTAQQLSRFSPFPLTPAPTPGRSRNFLLPWLGLALPGSCRAASALAASQCQGAVLRVWARGLAVLAGGRKLFRTYPTLPLLLRKASDPNVFFPPTVPGGAAQEGGGGTPEVSAGATAKGAHHRSGECDSDGGSR